MEVFHHMPELHRALEVVCKFGIVPCEIRGLVGWFLQRERPKVKPASASNLVHECCKRFGDIVKVLALEVHVVLGGLVNDHSVGRHHSALQILRSPFVRTRS